MYIKLQSLQLVEQLASFFRVYQSSSVSILTPEELFALISNMPGVQLHYKLP